MNAFRFSGIALVLFVAVGSLPAQNAEGFGAGPALEPMEGGLLGPSTSGQGQLSLEVDLEPPAPGERFSLALLDNAGFFELDQERRLETRLGEAARRRNVHVRLLTLREPPPGITLEDYAEGLARESTPRGRLGAVLVLLRGDSRIVVGLSPAAVGKTVAGEIATLANTLPPGENIVTSPGPVLAHSGLEVLNRLVGIETAPGFLARVPGWFFGIFGLLIVAAVVLIIRRHVLQMIRRNLFDANYTFPVSESVKPRFGGRFGGVFGATLSYRCKD